MDKIVTAASMSIMSDKRNKIFGIDFDGTLAIHEYPEIGAEVPDAIRVCKRLQASGHRLMLWTMRGNKPSDRDTLGEAVAWCKERGLEFWAINENTEQQASGWSLSHKQYAHIYIDDAALGCPLVSYYDTPDKKWNRFAQIKQHVDWIAVEEWLVEHGYFEAPYC